MGGVTFIVPIEKEGEWEFGIVHESLRKIVPILDRP